MIQPNMATMLGFVVTNAKVAQADLQAALSASANASFNRITVDGDTSTNDACMLAATGEGPALGPGSLHWPAFIDGLNQVMVELAQAIVRDGEGATKFVEIQVTGATSDEDAHQVAKTVAHSPLVKTALFASDANWGRILAAVGRAPIASLDVSQVQIWIGDVKLVSQGAVDSDYTEQAGAAVFAQSDIRFALTSVQVRAKPPSGPATSATNTSASMPTTEVKVAAGVIERDGQVLVTQRAAKAHQGGLWEFPGGKLESGKRRAGLGSGAG